MQGGIAVELIVEEEERADGERLQSGRNRPGRGNYAWVAAVYFVAIETYHDGWAVLRLDSLEEANAELALVDHMGDEQDLGVRTGRASSSYRIGTWCCFPSPPSCALRFEQLWKTWRKSIDGIFVQDVSM